MDALRRFRRNMGLSSYQLASEIGISKSFLEKIEAGVRNPSRNFILKMKTRYPDIDTNIFFKQ